MRSRPEPDLASIAAEPEAVRTVGPLLASVQDVLGDSLIAAWFDGSIALEAFDPQRSDIDLVVVASRRPSERQENGLRAAHAHCAVADRHWGAEIETIYVTRAALRPAAVSSGVPHLYVERGTGGQLVSGLIDPGWLVHLRVLRESGIAIIGPAPVNLVSGVSDEELKRFALWGLERWLVRYRDDLTMLDHVGARVFVVLSVCRLLYTRQTGQVVSKVAAARWALAAFPADLVPAIEGAMAWQKQDAASVSATVDRTVAIINWAHASGRSHHSHAVWPGGPLRANRSPGW